MFVQLLLIYNLLKLFNSLNWNSNFSLPDEHISYWLNRDERLRNECLADANCRSKHFKSPKVCWGYEPDCEITQSYSLSGQQCSKQNSWRIKDHNSQLLMFRKQGDFAKLADVINSIKPICTSNEVSGSTLYCSDHLRFCKASNIYFDFSNLNAEESSKRYRNDVIQMGQVGGKCDRSMDYRLLKSMADEKSYLQSWAHELEYFNSLENFELSSFYCDVVFDGPTVLIKLDASVNMYHHFCDFINLYASQHVNASIDMDIDIVWWDTWSGGYIDSLFGVTWKAFTIKRTHELILLGGKKVCFKNVMFSLLARQRFGLYYNMPLIDGCEGSGLVHAFSQHILHRLKIKQKGPLIDKLRVTLLSRSTQYRRIVNENELVQVLNEVPNVVVQCMDYNSSVPFLEQLEITHNSDIFIGIHGSGLTHLLFLPDWAAVFELYNCGDANCYLDLARLRGIKYFTWKKDDKMNTTDEDLHHHSAHEKFRNYRFDPIEFRRLFFNAGRNGST